MAAEAQFPLLLAQAEDARRACGPDSVPEGKGGYVFADRTLYRIRDLEAPVVGDAAFAYSVNEKELEQLCTHVDVTSLSFKGLRTTTIAPIGRIPRLRRLSMWWVQKLANLSPLSALPLDVLVLDDIRYANDIAPLADIASLKSLKISGGMNTTQLIDTLEPLTGLPALSELNLVALKLGDQSLRPLERCEALVDLWLPNTFETAEYAYLAAKRPDIRCEALAAYQTMHHPIGGKDIMVTGKRKPFLDSKTDAKRLATYQARFDAMVAEFRAGGST